MGLLTRVFQGIAGAGIGASQFAIISSLYHDKMDKMIGIQQTLLGISMIIGPLLGALLFLIGGFAFIFFVFTSFFVLIIPVTCFLVPGDVAYIKPENEVSWKLIFSVPTVSIDLLAIVFAFMAFGALEPLISPFMID